MGRDEALARWLMDSIKRLGDVSDDEEALRKHIFSTYRWLRGGMLVIAFVFPWWLSIGGLYYSVEWQDSMSAYYWAVPEEGGDAPMRVWFVGLLFALGTCLFLYKGYSVLENWVLNIASICAICVALIPMCWGLACPSLGGYLHYIFALGFFFLLAVVAILHGVYALGLLRSGRRQRLEDRQRVYAILYLVSAAAMPFAPLLTWLIFGAFVGEAVGIGAFCFFWLIQIVQIWASQFDEELAKSGTSRMEGVAE